MMVTGPMNMATAAQIPSSSWGSRVKRAAPSTPLFRLTPTTSLPSKKKRWITTRAIATPTSAPPSPQAPARSGAKRAGRITVNGLRVTTPGAWEVMYRELKTNKVIGIAPHEVKFALERNVAIVDVRVPREFATAHIPGAINVPIYHSITGWSPFKILRRVGFALFGVFNATESNGSFTEELARAVGGNKATEVILVCNSKGDLSRPPPPNNAELWHEVYQSRSLIAAYLATIDGFTRISVLRTGFKEWQREGRPVAKLSV